jgi:RNA polymerase sigma-70 factor (ECF subfamily)
MADEARTAQPDDATLLVRMAVNDTTAQRAIAAFYERWFPRFRAMAYRLTGNWSDSEDVAHDVVISVIVNAARYRVGRPAEPWLWRILRNRLTDRRRRNAVRAAVSTDDSEDGSAGAEIEAREPTAAEVAEAGEKSAAFQSALMRLTEDEREVLLLHYTAGLSYKALSDVTEIPVPQIGGLLFRARRRLGVLLQTEWPSLFPPRQL